ncbi:MAG: L,D-transpeptidase [bacterium]|nr:L,D-transpeptidase [bacterium]
MRVLKIAFLSACFMFGFFIIPNTFAECAPEAPCAEAETGLDDPVILAYPTPDVRQLAPNTPLISDRLYQRVLDRVDIHDAPGGNIVGSLDAGFNYFTTWSPEGEWTRINQDQWVRTELLRPTTPSNFSGVLLPETLQYPMAWVLVNVVPSRSPGAEPTPGDLAFLRYTKINLYTTVVVDGWEWYQVGIDQWIEQRNIARVLPVERPAEVDTEKWISVDLYEQVAIAYEGVRPVFATLVSSGLAEWPTNEGVFHVYVRYPRTIMSGAEGQPDFYYLEEVPWTMYFDGDIGLHGTYWHDGFGYRHSHGCVNLSITDSHWLYDWASSEIDLTIPADTGAAVYVYSSGIYR